MYKDKISSSGFIDKLLFPQTIPPYLGWKLLVKIGKEVWKRVKDLLSESEINENSTVQDIESINTALLELRKQIYNDSTKQIDDAKSSVTAYIKDLQFLLDEKKSILGQYNIRYKKMYRLLNEIENGVESFWKAQIQNFFSLDNIECRKILMIPACGRKEKELNEFIMKARLSIIMEFSKHVRDELNIISDILLEDFDVAVKNIEVKTKQFGKLCEDVEHEDTKEIEYSLSEAELKYWLCEESQIDLEG